jgi:protocatechuate 3,4-dioxygenase beta subunit
MTSELHTPNQPAGDAATGLSRGRLLRRAGALGLVAAAGSALEAGPALAAETAVTGLTLTPEQEEGPFYVAVERIRKNVTEGKPGVPLQLQVKVVTAAGTPIARAACDIWQCDATGVYGDESSENTVGKTWLRGVQFTDAKGVAEFVTIYPGHYQGRATHIHVKVHVGGKARGATYTGGHVSHTGQLLFDDTISTQVYRQSAYAADTAARVPNGQDHVYTEQGGAVMKLRLGKLGATVAQGYLATMTLIVDPSATPAGVGVGG